MKSPSLDFSSLQVRDLEASRQSYSEVLGFRALRQNRPDAVVFENSYGASFAIRNPLVNLEEVPRLGWGTGLWFGIEDAEALHARARSHQISILAPLSEGPFGRMFVLRDPDDYALTFHEVQP